MSLLTLTGVSLAFGHHPLLNNVDLKISAADRICLVGRNGAGKSTLLRVISGAIHPDDGEVRGTPGLRVSHLEQEFLPPGDATVYQLVASGLGELGRLLTDYHDTAAEQDLARLADLQRRIEAVDGWNMEQKILATCSRLSLPISTQVRDCSGGTRRKVMLATALVSAPDLLLLDEPTNHMDIGTITWLEEFLNAFHGALVFITHDRTLIRHLAQTIVELDRGTLTCFAGNFDTYLRRKDELADIEARSHARQDKVLAEHEAWIRRGVKARRTRDEGRVRKLKALRRERARRLEVLGSVRMSPLTAGQSGKRVIELQHVSFSYGTAPVVQDLSTSILRGDRVGIIGPNGSGKSTLLKIVMGELAPQQGRVVTGTGLQVSYFDQERSQLELEKTVRDNVGGGNDFVSVNGKPRHVVGYLKDFLFSPERINTPVKALSGGERNRLLLAKMFTRPANLLVLDEPTNDLDMDTLELLEDLLADYEGTLLLVSHDRTFIDNIATNTLVFEGEGVVAEYVGGYEDWLRQRKGPQAPAPSPIVEKKTARSARPDTGRRATKLSYKQRLELAELPDRIDSLERQHKALQAKVIEPEFYRQDKAAITTTLESIEELNRQLEQAYKQWEQLDSAGV